MINARVAQYAEHRLKHDGGRVAKVSASSNGVMNRERCTEDSRSANLPTRTIFNFIARIAQRAEHHLKHSGGRVATVGEGIHGVINRDGQIEGSCGSNPAARTNHHNWRLFEWAREIGNPLYMTRWMIDLGLFSIRLHKFSRSDDQRAFHDHAWSFLTIILKGGYWDVTENGREWCGPGSIRFRKQNHRHTVVVPEGKPSWSLVITGPYVHRWGFYVKNKLGQYKFLNSQRYFRRFGHH